MLSHSTQSGIAIVEDAWEVRGVDDEWGSQWKHPEEAIPLFFSFICFIELERVMFLDLK